MATPRLDFLHDALPAGNGVGRAPGTSLSFSSSGAAQRRRFVRQMGVLAMAVASAGLVDEGVAWRRWVADYQTGVGKRQEVDFGPHTRLLLNTRTAVNVGSQDNVRHIRLLSGELLARQDGQADPVIIDTHDGHVASDDARLVLRRLGGQTTINVLHGQARVFPAAGRAGAAQQLYAGQRLVLDSHGAGQIQPIRDAEVAWVNGQIVAQDMKLADFIDELQRYSPEILRYDPGVANLLVNGRFSLADVKGVFRWLSSSLPLRVDIVEHRWGSSSLMIHALG